MRSHQAPPSHTRQQQQQGGPPLPPPPCSPRPHPCLQPPHTPPECRCSSSHPHPRPVGPPSRPRRLQWRQMWPPCVLPDVPLTPGPRQEAPHAHTAARPQTLEAGGQGGAAVCDMMAVALIPTAPSHHPPASVAVAPTPPPPTPTLPIIRGGPHSRGCRRSVLFCSHALGTAARATCQPARLTARPTRSCAARAVAAGGCTATAWAGQDPACRACSGSSGCSSGLRCDSTVGLEARRRGGGVSAGGAAGHDGGGGGGGGHAVGHDGVVVGVMRWWWWSDAELMLMSVGRAHGGGRGGGGHMDT